MNPSNAWPLFLAIVMSTALGYGLTACLLPASFAWLRLAIAPGVGVGVSAFVIFLFRRPMFTVEFALLATTIVLLWRSRMFIVKGFRASVWRGTLVALTIPAITLALSAFAVRIHRMPHGNWDGWAIWNWEARLLYRAGPHWRDYLPRAFHGDYPLLVSSTTARFWRYAGNEIPEAGALLAAMLALCSVAVLALTISKLRGAALGTLMGLILVGTPSYLDYATSQYADVPLSFYYVASLALIAIYFEREQERDGARILILAGFLAGCAGWTKNEGIVFLIGAGITVLLPVFRDRSPRAAFRALLSRMVQAIDNRLHSPAPNFVDANSQAVLDAARLSARQSTWVKTLHRFAAFLAGAAFPAAVIALFKITNSVSNYVVAYEPSKLEKVLDVDRHAMILSYVGKHIFSFGLWTVSPFIPLLAFILFSRIRRRVFTSYGWLTIAVTLAIVTVSYYFVYLMTPVELKVHLETSLDRLLLQLWPSLLLLTGLSLEGS